jgi:hypothetical protein
LIDEFLVRPSRDSEESKLRIANIIPSATKNNINHQKILLHGHCYQKTRPPKPDSYASGLEATVSMLTATGYQVEVVDAGCCGVAGAFGYEAEHYNLSIKIGEMALLPAIRRSDKNVILATSGVSCKAQIEDGSGKPTFHPIQLVEKYVFDNQ